MNEKDKVLLSPPKDNYPVVYESYDEVVFTDPTESFFKKLMKHLTVSMPKVHSHELQVEENFKTYSDEKDFMTLLTAQNFLDSELKTVKERILLAETSKKELDEVIDSANIHSMSQ